MAEKQAIKFEDTKPCETEGPIESSDMLCDPCLEDKDYKVAEGFCVDCNDYLCAECYDVHRKPKPSKKHVLKGILEMPIRAFNRIKEKERSEKLSGYCNDRRYCTKDKASDDICQDFIKSGDVHQMRDDIESLTKEFEEKMNVAVTKTKNPDIFVFKSQPFHSITMTGTTASNAGMATTGNSTFGVVKNSKCGFSKDVRFTNVNSSSTISPKVSPLEGFKVSFPSLDLKPVVPLLDKDKVKTGEENEEVLFTNKAKLYRRFNGEWGKRGYGSNVIIEVLINTKTKESRILMKRDANFEFLCNHIINEEIKFEPIPNSNGRPLVWYAMDFSEGLPTAKQYAIKFRDEAVIPEFETVIKYVNDRLKERLITTLAEGRPTTIEAVRAKMTPMESNNKTFTTSTAQLTSKGLPFYSPPVVPLLDKDKVKTGEENEEVLFTNKAKLYRRFNGEWGKRGYGSNVIIEVLINTKTKESRILMKRDANFEFFCNHIINEEIKFEPIPNSNGRPLVWYAMDFSEGLPTAKQYAIKFRDEAVIPEFETVIKYVNDRLKERLITTLAEGRPTTIEAVRAKMTPMESNNKTFTTSTAQLTSKGLPFYSPPKDAQIIKPTAAKKSEFNASLNVKLFLTDMKSSKTADSDSSITSLKSPEVSAEGFNVTKDDIDSHITSKRVVPLSGKEEIKTGEEGEDVVFTHRAELFVYLNGQWKERGVGPLKVLFHAESKKGRILMRQDVDCKICFHQYIAEGIKIRPLPNSNNDALIWYATDLSEDTPKFRKFSISFKDKGLTTRFEAAIQEVKDRQKESSNASLDEGRSTTFQTTEAKMASMQSKNTVHLKNESGFDTDSDVHIVKVEKASENQIKKARELQLPDHFYLYEDLPNCSGCRGCNDDLTFERSQRGEHKRGVDDKEVKKDHNKNGYDKEERSIGSEGKTKPFQWPGAGNQLFGAETSRHNAPVVPEPIEVTTGEEDETQVFCQRAKIFRFDTGAKQWKERGIGAMKILKHKHTGKYRLLHRRDQVYKLVCNHVLTPDLTFKPLESSETTWCWTAHDFSEPEGRVEQLAIRFKTLDLARGFKDKIDEIQNDLCQTLDLAKAFKDSLTVTDDGSCLKP